MNDESTSPIHPARPAKKWRVIEGLMAGANQAVGRTMPHSLDAEEYLLSCILIDANDVLARCEIMKLTPEAFYDSKHGIIYDVCLDMWRKNFPVSIDTLAEELKTRRLLEQVGGYPFLVQITRRLATTAQASFFLQKVFELGLVRALVRDGTMAVEDAYGYTGNIDELLGRVASKFQRLADFALRRNRKPQRQIAEEARAYAQAAMAGTLDKSRIMPLGGLPHTTQMFQPLDVREEDWFTLIGALPNVGKSTLARQHVGYSLLAGGVWIVFLLETSRLKWLNALAGMLAGVPSRTADLEEMHALFPDKAKKFDEWMSWIVSIMDHQLWIFDEEFYLEDIERQIREINRRVRERQLSEAIAAGKSSEDAHKLAHGVDGVLGDHLHIVQTRKEFRANREAQVSHIGRTLKMIGKTLDIYNIWCAQLNRASTADNRRPKKSDLRDSGSLEQDADVILLLHKPDENKNGNKQTGDQLVHEVELIQAKRRNGPAGVAVDLLHHTKIGSYEELTKPSSDPRPGQPKPKGGYKREAKK